MKTSFIPDLDVSLVPRFAVQGFRPSLEEEIKSYVFVAAGNPQGDLVEIELSPEDANILGEELRKHAEFASNTTTLEEK